MSAWTELFSKLLEKRGLNDTQFADAVSGHRGNISKLRRGVPVSPGKPPLKAPLEKLSMWADVLRLEGRERHEFFVLAFREHCPEATSDQVEDALLGRVADKNESGYRVEVHAELIKKLEDRLQAVTDQLSAERKARADYITQAEKRLGELRADLDRLRRL